MNTEQWRAVVGWEGLYSVSDLGRVRSEPHLARHQRGGTQLIRSTVLRQNKNKGGYPTVCLSREGIVKRRLVHRLVLEAFVGPCPPGMEGAHGDGDRSNARRGNLRWDTPSGNCADKIAHGTDSRGERHNMAKLTAEQVSSIRADARSQRTVAREFGVTQSNVSHIKRGRSWSHIN